jgi:thiosulfate/3-mercaptopyruvate sulfurtransferase
MDLDLFDCGADGNWPNFRDRSGGPSAAANTGDAIMSVILFSRRAFIGAALSFASILSLAPGVGSAFAEETTKSTSQWVVDAPTALGLISKGAIVLDTRGDDLKTSAPLEGAQAVIWQDFTNPDLPNKGQLLSDDDVLTGKLRALGISADKAVIAVADSKQGWGEDGRIVWTLRTLGHTQAYLVDGGIAALAAKGAPSIAPVTASGDFTVHRVADYEIKKEELVEELASQNLVILDTREQREYDGETPYGESRGGHVPGAKHIFYKDLVGEDGRILPRDQLNAKLAALGVTENTEVVSYCTGGIRSGFVTAVLNDAGVKARNYAGSMWEWSAAPADKYPLVTR